MDQYYIIKILGRGAEGQVLLAEHKKTHEHVAIKRLEWSSLDDVNQHLNESNKIKQLNHKNIIKYKRVFLHNYSPVTRFVCLCLEYCPKGDFSRVIEREWSNGHKMHEGVIIQYTSEICEGLAYLHEHNILHRDLKPQNILLSDDGVLKISDFGISRELGNSGIAHTQCGTVHYMSWEMLNNQPYDEKTDMYSLGVILLQMMTGKSIMVSIELGKNPNLFRELEENLTKNFNFSKDIVHLFQKLVSFNPAERPTARQTLDILRNMKRRREEQKISIKEFSMFPDIVKLNIFLFFDCQDIYLILMTSKKMYHLINDYWFEQYCMKTNIGKQMLHATNSLMGITSKKEPINYKERVYLYHKIIKPKIMKGLSQQGKQVTSEILPNQIDEASIFLSNVIFETVPKFVNYCISQSNQNMKKSELIFLCKSIILFGVKYGRVWVSNFFSKSGNREIQAISIWRSPYSTSNIGFSKFFRMGFLNTVRMMSITSIIRTMSLVEYMEKQHISILDRRKKPHWHLIALGVKKGCYNEGIGSSVMIPILKAADETLLPIFTTVMYSSSDYVNFFKRHGFDAIHPKNPKPSLVRSDDTSVHSLKSGMITTTTATASTNTTTTRKVAVATKTTTTASKTTTIERDLKRNIQQKGITSEEKHDKDR